MSALCQIKSASVLAPSPVKKNKSRFHVGQRVVIALWAGFADRRSGTITAVGSRKLSVHLDGYKCALEFPRCVVVQEKGVL